jgi:heme exporter protein C
MPAALGMAFLYAPDEKVMGAVQRIFYFHVPAAIMTFLSVYVLLAGALGYLWTRQEPWDRLARGATELGLLFCTLVLVTGPIWAKSAWGVWWTWEAKLTTTLILWLLLAASALVRSYAESRELAARLGAVLGIVAAVDVPIIYKAVDWWRGQHPQIFRPGSAAPLAREMKHAFVVCLLVFAILYALLLALRVRLAGLEDRAAALAERASELEGPDR